MTSTNPDNNPDAARESDRISTAEDDFGSRPNASPPNLIVGVGASAGGLEALERLFRNMPLDAGMAFVVIQHLSPNFESMMDELLIRQTRLPVHIVADRVQVEADAIYLIPPGKEMIISEGRLLLTDKDPRDGLSLPIDQFFRSLASDVGNRGVGVVLSGTGSDGSRGIRDIHEAGGLVIAQTEETAKFDGMPRSATETGVVDLLLSPEDIGPTLERYIQNPVIGELPTAVETPVDENSMNRLLRMLRDAHGIDFSFYKPGTVRRRIERRLMMNHSSDFEQYVVKVEQNSSELDLLYHDLLIGVTQFFRDAEAFRLLERQVIPEIIETHEDGDELRVWVAGCATGEEAYSLGIVIDEVMRRMKREFEVKIFATDVHQVSLDFAGTGIYPAASVGEVSDERLDRYFRQTNEQFQVCPSLRKMVVFAEHNIIKDAPFTKLDLITCRNLLIYLQPAVQKKAISLFHFGLRTGGVLFLGPSEGVADLENEFTSIDRHWKVFRKRRDVPFPVGMRLPLTPSAPALRLNRPSGMSSIDRNDGELLHLYNQVMDQCVTTAVLIDEQHNVRHVFGDADRYLRVRRGRPSHSLLSLLDPELRTAVAGAVQRAMKEQKTIAYSGLQIKSDDGPAELQVTITPLASQLSASSHLLVRFEETAANPAISPVSIETLDIGEVSRERTEALENELRRTRESLQATIEELETSNEELHATNEEIVASNEELQSTNEELHSVNEELYSVNAEYQRKIGELTELTDDMQHLLESTDVGTVFLDRELSIRKVTPRAARTFNIVDHDIGRKFEGFADHVQHSSLMDDIHGVLQGAAAVECEIRDRLGQWFFLRILPYRSRGEIRGVVVTLIDTQALHSAQRELREKDRQLRSILANAPAFIFIHDDVGRYLLANHQSHRWLGHAAEDVIGKTDRDFLPLAIADNIHAMEREVMSSGKAQEVELVMPVPNSKEQHTWLTVMFPLRDDAGRINSVAGIATDISVRKRSEQQVLESLRQRDQFLAMLSHELRNPLGAMQNGLRLLRHDGLNADVQERTKSMLESQASQMAHLLDDLLDVSRIEHNRVELHRRIVDLKTTTTQAAAALETRFADAEIEFELRLDDDDILVDGDPARLQQVQINLLVNAVKYTPSGGRVTLEVRKEGPDAVIVVKDTGFGISADLLPRIFEPFVQADDTLNRADGGMGVGLSLAKSLVELHGGRISAHSNGPGRGSDFTIVLPLSKSLPHQKSVTESDDDSALQTAECLTQPGELDIVLVEDNEPARTALEMLLQIEGFRVRSFSDGLTAVDAIAKEPPDVAMVDIGLPGLDGYQVAARVRAAATSKYVFLIAATGYGQPQDRQRTKVVGFDLHLTKPIKFDHLKDVLRRVAQDRSAIDSR